jgi:hypothetical protein
MMRWTRPFFLIAFLPIFVYGQPVSDSTESPVKRKSLRIAAISSAAGYSAGLAGLNHLWYRNTDRQSFRFFNDNAEWKQVDKIGHLYSSFYFSYGFAQGLRHFNVTPQKADITGSILGFAVLVPIEVFDGFSEAYGASVGDLIADGAGALLYYSQRRLWDEVRLYPKFSFHTTRYADLRPELLGEGMERIIKDYNGQTYWLSLDIDKFMKFPKWLNIAVGYGANGMVYARDEQHPENGYPQPYRQYYLSIDLDPSAINTRSKALRTILFIAGMIRIPAPALELSRQKVRAHAFYF